MTRTLAFEYIEHMPDDQSYDIESQLDKAYEQEPDRFAPVEDGDNYAYRIILCDRLYRAFDALFELGRPTYASFNTRDYPGCDEVARCWAIQNGWVTDEHDVDTELGRCHVMVVRKTRDILSWPLITIMWPPVRP